MAWAGRGQIDEEWAMILRVVQLVSRYVGVALLWVAAQLGGSEEQASEVAVQVGAAVGAVLGLLMDLVIHAVKTGGPLRPAGPVPGADEAKRELPGMDMVSRLVLLVVLLAGVWVVGGCGSRPNVLKVPSQIKIDLYDADIRASIREDPTLTAEQRAGRLRALDDYQAAVDAAPPAGRFGGAGAAGPAD